MYQSLNLKSGVYQLNCKSQFFKCEIQIYNSIFNSTLDLSFAGRD